MGRAIGALMLREMSTTYGRSSMGYFWALAEPIGGIAFLTVIFSLALRSPSIGDSFALYYATGMLPMQLFTQTSNKTAASIKFSKALLGYPRVTFVDAIIARITLNSLTHFVISFVLIGGMVIVSPSFVFLNVPQMALAFMMAVSLALGFGMMNCFLFWRLPVWKQLWGILTRPLFLISGVLYNFEDLPQNAQDILWYNPVVHVIGQMRMGVFATYEPTYISYIYVFGLSITFTALGLVLLKRYYNDIMFK